MTQDTPETYGWVKSEVPDYHYHMKPCHHVDDGTQYGKYVTETDAHFAIGHGYTNSNFPGLYLIHGSNIHEREKLAKDKWYVVDKTNGPQSEHDSAQAANDILENDQKNKIEVHITSGEYVEDTDADNELNHFNYEVKQMSLLEIKRHLESSDRMHDHIDNHEDSPYAKHVKAALEGKGLNDVSWASLAGGHGGMNHPDGHWRNHYENLHFKPEDWEKVEDITDDVH